MKKRGSFTIEASLIVPFLLFVVLFMMHLSLFLYHREALTVIASRAVLKGVQMEQEGRRRIEKEVSSFVEEEIRSRLVFAESVRREVTVTGGKVQVTLELTQNTPFKVFHFKVTKEMKRQRPVFFLWEKERFQSVK